MRIPNLYLYDSIGDCIMALRFGYVDAIAVDALYAYSMVAEYPDLAIQDRNPSERTPWWPTSPTPAGTFWSR